jgi:hypothetical protein
MSENCPFCRYYIPEGATVCGHCGAVKRRVSADKISFAGDNFGLSAFLALAVFILNFLAWKNSFLFSLLFAAIIFVIVFWFEAILVLAIGVPYAIGGAAFFGFFFYIFKWPLWLGVAIGIIGVYFILFNIDSNYEWFRE